MSSCTEVKTPQRSRIVGWDFSVPLLLSKYHPRSRGSTLCYLKVLHFITGFTQGLLHVAWWEGCLYLERYYASGTLLMDLLTDQHI